MIDIFLLSMLIGLVAGAIAGLFGLGGGVLIVPALIWLYSESGFPAELVMIMAVATSLATIVFTSVAAILAHHKLKAIRWQYVLRLVPGILVGAGVGAIAADFIEADKLKWCFIVYLLFSAAKVGFPQKQVEIEVRGGGALDYMAGSVIGLLSSGLGIGGGTLTVPYLMFRQLSIKNAVAVSSVCGFPIAISGSLAYMFLGWQVSFLPEWSFGYVYLPALAGIIICSVVTAPLGARMANKLPAKKIKKYFSIVLILIAVKMIFI